MTIKMADGQLGDMISMIFTMMRFSSHFLTFIDKEAESKEIKGLTQGHSASQNLEFFFLFFEKKNPTLFLFISQPGVEQRPDS